ncbi:RCC1/BLIP-II protein [Ceratobasidium sp. AG-Ba]|nr:RCC1/BLIP-II protein [Ceratobasidium sp. AG-Ba]
MTNISELPIEVLIDSLLPALALRDLLALGCTNKFFAAVCADDTFWKRKTEAEYNFSGAGSARTSGFKHVYRGLRHPRVFVWGESDNSRLALSKRKHQSGASRWDPVDYPVELDLKWRVVHLAAGGWSFHALTDDGRVLVWGTLDADGPGFGSDDLTQSRSSVEEPIALILPQRIKSLSVGRRHSILLDARNDAWIVRSWGRPARLVTPVLDNAHPESSIVQVDAGWDVCAFLTETGEVFVVFPFRGSFDQEAKTRMGEDGGEQSEIVPQDGEVRCGCWDIEHHPTRLPALPARLPTLHRSTDATTQDTPPRLVKIAAGDDFIVGLTDGGHVLKLDLPTRNEADLRQAIERGNSQWNYLPRFCDVAHVRNESDFRQQGQGQEDQRALEDLTVTHISAQFRTFVVYSTVGSSVVLLGKAETTSQEAPTIIPELQYRNVISVVLGDYHYCALTADGELFSWGKYSNGALGLGSSPRSHGAPHHVRIAMMPMLHQPVQRRQEQDAPKPTRVRFDHEDNVQGRHVFAVAAAGWHCGALVIDLHSSSSASGESPAERPEAQPVGGLQTGSDSQPGASTSRPIAQLPRRTEGEFGGTQAPQITLPIVRGRGGVPFRIGYAARGAYAGRGRGFSASQSGSGAHDGTNPGRAEE